MDLLGTPLSSTDKKFVPEWKQEARDELGRKHFHGAFTGGFQAGYHNTVGSREGWTPASFTGEKQRVEDFMDEEDLRDRNRQKLVATEEYNTQRQQVVGRRDGIGWQIMRRMGWKGDINEKGPANSLIIPHNEDSFKAAGFGVSVLEEEDQDIYSGPKESFVPFIDFTKQSQVSSSTINRDTGCIDGFVQAMATSLKEVEYPPPAVPDNFVPKGLGLQSVPQTRPARTIEERANALGETYISPEWKEKTLDAAAELLPETQESLPVELDRVTALSAQQGFMPFQTNPSKDARYRQFLAHYASPITGPLPERPRGMSATEHYREQEEFVKSANIYKPLAANMASKFVSSKKALVSDEPKSGLHTPQPKTLPAAETPQGIPEPDQSIPQYGVGTRKVSAWTPTTNLCKLFGIDPTGSEEQTPASVNPVLSMVSLQKIVSGSKFADKVDSEIFDAKEEEIEEEQIEITENLDKPALALFKSIFEDDSEEVSVGTAMDVGGALDVGDAIGDTEKAGAQETIVTTSQLSIDPESLLMFNTQESIVFRPKSTKRKNAPRLVAALDETVHIVTPIATQSKVKPTAASVDDDDSTAIVTVKKKRPDASDFW